MKTGGNIGQPYVIALGDDVGLSSVEASVVLHQKMKSAGTSRVSPTSLVFMLCSCAILTKPKRGDPVTHERPGGKLRCVLRIRNTQWHELELSRGGFRVPCNQALSYRSCHFH